MNENNDRQHYMDPNYGREVFDNEDLDPNIEAVKPGLKGFKYMPPAEVGPEHPPDKDLAPEHWQFYDVNLDAVREDTKKGV